MNNEIYKFKISGEHVGERIDNVLSLLMEDSSRSYIQKLIESGFVSVDGLQCFSKKEKLKEGCTVTLLLPKDAPCEALPEELPLDIIYEDTALIVVNKPKGMVIHPAAGNPSGTLANGLLAHCGALSSINGPARPGIVHRLDKDTSGLLVAAKWDAAHIGLAAQFAGRLATRLYRGICFFKLDGDFTVDAPIARDPNNRLRMAVVEGGKDAVTHIGLLQQFVGYSEFSARLETGRTHQIRVHMAYKNHPLLGDTVYGPRRQPLKLSGQMLHAETLGFEHPITGRYMEFSVEAPEEYLRIKERLSK